MEDLSRQLYEFGRAKDEDMCRRGGNVTMAKLYEIMNEIENFDFEIDEEPEKS